MNKNKSGFSFLLIFCSLAFILAGCAGAPPVKEPNPKTWEGSGASFVFDGEYLIDKKVLTISVNGDSVMTGSFPPFTPAKTMNVDYQGHRITANCYAGSVLSSSIPGVGSAIADAIQGAKGKSSDSCAMSVDEDEAGTLYFELVENEE